MRAALALAGGAAAAWCAVGGLVLLMTHRAVMEVLVVEVAGLTLAVLSAAVLIVDGLGS